MDFESLLKNRVFFRKTILSMASKNPQDLNGFKGITFSADPRLKVQVAAQRGDLLSKIAAGMMMVSGPRRKWLDRHLRERAKLKDHPFLSRSPIISTVHGGFKIQVNPIWNKESMFSPAHVFMGKKQQLATEKKKGHDPPRSHLKTVVFLLNFKCFECIVVVSLGFTTFETPK